MSMLLKALRQQALIVANAIKLDSKNDESKVKKSYARVKTLDKEICPKCWVKNESLSNLEIVAYFDTSGVNSYKCEVCDFKALLPMSENNNE